VTLAYTPITGEFLDGSDRRLTGTATFTPSQAVYASGIPVVTPGRRRDIARRLLAEARSQFQVTTIEASLTN
jgi:hypothetical protein